MSRQNIGVLAIAIFALVLTACGHISMVSPQPGSMAMAPSQGPLSQGDFTLPNGRLMTDTWAGIHPFQVFDFNIKPGDATKHAYRYDFVWGSGKPGAWKAGNPNIVTSWYGPFDGDFTLKHDLTWWKANHPSWILYQCDEKKLANMDGLKNVPLDISNPAVVRWQMQTYAPQIEAGGYDGFAGDLVGLDNSTGGCGVFVNGVWTPRFSGQKVDPAWTQAVVAWHTFAFHYLHRLSRPLLLGANTVPESRPYGDPDMDQLIAHVDVIDDESSFTDYGNGYASADKVALIVQWMKYVQQQGVAYIVDDKWNTNTLSEQQFDWGLSTYMLGKYHLASVFIDHLPGYGKEYWMKQYATKIGSPCSDAYADPNDKGVLYRKYALSFVVVNSSSSQSYTVNLPQHSYQDIWGNTVTSPLHLTPDDAEVLLTTANGCT